MNDWQSISETSASHQSAHQLNRPPGSSQSHKSNAPKDANAIKQTDQDGRPACHRNSATIIDVNAAIGARSRPVAELYAGRAGKHKEPDDRP
jgi:hypothetical protein